jgi:hypothetical protein
MIFTELTSYLQSSPGNVSYFFLILAKQSKYTHIKAPLSSLCSFIKPHLWNPHPLHPIYFIKKMLLKNISSVITVVIFTDICVWCFSILMAVDPQKWSLVWYISKNGVAHNSMLHSQHLIFVLVSFSLVNFHFGGTHSTKLSYIE